MEDNSADVEVWEFGSEDETEVCSSSPATSTMDSVPSESLECEKPSILIMIGFICIFLFSWQAVFQIPDGAINVLFKFFSLLFRKMHDVTGSDNLRMLHQNFPSSLTLARKVQSGNYEDFQKLTVCQKCFTTYRY